MRGTLLHRKIKHAYAPSSNSFAYGLNFYKLFWIFFIGCIIGFIVESIYCYSSMGHVESRKGLIYGPFSPIYGAGAVFYTLLLYKLKDAQGAIIFIVSGITGAIFEFLCSYFQELFFGTISWDYSNTPLNLSGRTNLLYAICWGALGLFFFRTVLPFVDNTLSKLSKRCGRNLTIFLVILMVLDILISICAVKRSSQRKAGIPPQTVFSEFLDKYYDDDFLSTIYPNMIFKN